jgi:hypothetical protein
MTDLPAFHTEEEWRAIEAARPVTHDPYPRASNAELDMIALRQDRKRLPGLPYKLFREMSLEATTRDWLIKGIFAKGETSAWIGPPGSLKSSIMASAALSIASGTDWFGYRNKGKAAVAIFALERADLVRRRLQAQAERDGLPSDLPIAVVPGILDLMDARNVPKVIDTLRNIEDDFGLPVGWTTFDTFAKAISAGGGDENMAKDQGRVFSNLQRIKDHMRPHISLVGHTGKDESKGARGSNAIKGDVDLLVMLSGDTIRTATVDKANDGPEGPLFSFTSEVHEFGTDEDGEPVTVNIVSRETVEAKATGSAGPQLSRNQRTMFGILHEAGAGGLSLHDWNERTRDAGIGTSRKADLHDIRTALKGKGIVHEHGGMWRVRHDG